MTIPTPEGESGQSRIQIGKPMPKPCPACQAISTAGYCKLPNCPTAPDPTPQPAPVDVVEGRRLLAEAEEYGGSDELRVWLIENAPALLSAAEERDAAKAESGASTKTLLSLPSGDYPVHANVAEAFEVMRSERDGAAEALRRLGSMEAFEFSRSINPAQDAELLARVIYARDALASLTKEGGE